MKKMGDRTLAPMHWWESSRRANMGALPAGSSGLGLWGGAIEHRLARWPAAPHPSRRVRGRSPPRDPRGWVDGGRPRRRSRGRAEPPFRRGAVGHPQHGPRRRRGDRPAPVPAPRDPGAPRHPPTRRGRRRGRHLRHEPSPHAPRFHGGPHPAAARAGDDLRPAQRAARHASNSVATIRSSWTPAAAGDASHTTGGPMTAGSSSRERMSGRTSSGTIPVAVAPPGRSAFTVTGEPARSAAITRESASTPAPAGPYGTNPARTIVSRFIEMFTTRPPPARSIRGTTARATRKQPVTFVSSTSRKPSGVTAQNGCGSSRKRGFTVRIPIPALFTSTSRPPIRDHAASMPTETASAERTSIARPTAESPISEAAARARSSDRLVTTTAAPAPASARAIARPSPLVAPVTSARIPSSFAMRRTVPRARGIPFGGAVMIVMTPHASPAEVEAVTTRLKTTGVHVVVMPGELTTAIGAIGDPEGVAELGLEGMAGVDRVVPISRPYKLASSELSHEQPTVLDINGRTIGGGDTFCLIAGPCTVESREQTLGVARAVKEAGASMLRGGAFKPRTSPFAFKGLGAEALEILAEARQQTGLPVVTELLDSQHAEAIFAHADVVQIGARNMQNYALLEVAGKLGKPVLLKRGLSSSLDELLQAADYILKEGNEAVMLCERGIRTFETATRFTLDLGAVPWLKLHTHLPVIVDPSHAAGDRRLVEPLSRAAAAVGADGIIVEVHQDPEVALCDGPQALEASHFADYARDVAAHAALVGRVLA